MKNNMIELVKFLPKWKITIYLVLSFCLALVTGIILLPIIWYLEDNSRFFENLLFLLSYFRELIFFVFYGVTMVFYLFLFYQYERKQYLAFYLKRITEDVQTFGDRNIGEISCPAEFHALAEGIQRIIEKSEAAIKEVKRVEQLKNELVTNVAHDLRSPLTSIIGYLDLINNDRYRDEVELRHFVQVIHDKAASLHVLINDIFEYTYVQNQQIKLQNHPIHIEEMLNQLAVQSRTQVEEAEMEWRFISHATNPTVMGDGEKLVRVFENLVQNAIRYGHDGKYIDMILSDTDESVVIEISNYGQAIPSADLPHIFERFYRVEKSRSNITGGSGLGLAIAKSIVDLHHGQIEVTSSAGRTAFMVTLRK
ncbi:sensor histidine kinase [Robertmurraya sp. P23]|uniref:sensor histidine kinase n=1 Tax=Robertmurraya sp. P23 TaxID=3436931 RepID=UPI003D9831B6